MIKKITSYKPKIFKILFFLLFILTYDLLLTTYDSFAQEITILYTGETHAMLYPCSCPVEPDGGVARRAFLVRRTREIGPDVLLLDSGGFFSGGLQDEYTQNTALDMQRAAVNLNAMHIMKYDAAVIGDDEFNFGRDFLEKNIAKKDVAFLSCNVFDASSKQRIFRPYIIREVAGVKIGIIGVTNPLAGQKVSSLKFTEPRSAVKEAVAQLKKENVNIIILLSHLGESEDANLIKEVEGIDILIVGHSRSKEENFTKVGHTLIIRPSWQGRRLGELFINLKDNKIANYKIEEARLSDQIANDPEILSILPRCFSDNNCKQEGAIGNCLDPGTMKSRCAFTQADKVPLLIITTKLCSVCNTEFSQKYLKGLFPGLSISYLYYPDSKAKKIINNTGIETLPAYLLGKEAAKEAGFDKLKENLLIKGDYYLIKPEYMGFGYFLNRKKIEGRLDLFFSLYDKITPDLLDTMKEFNPIMHFLAAEKAPGSFEALGGGSNLEVEEDLRSACVQKYYPERFWDYLSCRANSINSSWWQDCLGGLETDKISMCARGDEGKGLLRDNISLNKELHIIIGPTYLVDNQEVFGFNGVPEKEKFRKAIKR